MCVYTLLNTGASHKILIQLRARRKAIYIFQMQLNPEHLVTSMSVALILLFAVLTALNVTDQSLKLSLVSRDTKLLSEQCRTFPQTESSKQTELAGSKPSHQGVHFPKADSSTLSKERLQASPKATQRLFHILPWPSA